MAGVRAELIAGGFSFPTSAAFDDQGQAFIAESGLTFGGAAPGGRVWGVEPGGQRSLVVAGLRAPVNGLTWHGGSLYVSEGGHPGRISRLDRDGTLTTILDGLPGPGNYHTNMSAFGPDGKLYFSQGAMTNSGVVGLDAFGLGWLRRLPHAHDLPGLDIVLAGEQFETADPFDPERASTKTGAFVPFGNQGEPGRRIAGQLPCTSAVMRCNTSGTGLELVAWGLRNAYGLAFMEDGRLLAVDQGADDRGSRPIGNAPDLLYEVRAGSWYGWPDFIAGVPVTSDEFKPERGPQPGFVLANHSELPLPERPLLRFPPHSAAVKLLATPVTSDWGGSVLVALFGDERPMTAPIGPRVGRSLAAVDPYSWTLQHLESATFERPIDVVYNASDRHVYLVDFGRFEMNADNSVAAVPGSGGLWRLSQL
jgi:glucose/arabinose dehydrogenase